MKRLALFITIILIISIFLTSVYAYGLKFDEDSAEGKSIPCVDFLDFNQENNNWAIQDETGKWIINPNTDNAWDENNDWFPSQAVVSRNKNYGTPIYTEDKLEWSLLDNGEILHLESISISSDPGMTFVLDADHCSINVGREKNGSMEYCKIRIKNYSNSKQFTLGFITSIFGSGYKFVPLTITDVPVESDSSEWITYTFSVPEYNENTNYDDSLKRDNEGNPVSRWYSYLYSILIFPFGYNVENGQGAYEGATMDIDYIVFGSKEYVTSYQSNLEKKGDDVVSIKIIKEPEKKIYYVDEKINLDGLEVELTHKDGTKEILNKFNAKYDFSKPSESTNVTIEYYGNTKDKFNVKVIGISEIKLESGPENLQYHLIFAEDEIKNSNIKLRVVYDDGKYSIIDLEDTKYNYDFSTPGEKIVNVDYYGKSYSFKVDVLKLDSIRIDSVEQAAEYASEISIDSIVCIFEDEVEKTLTLKSDIAKTIVNCDTNVKGPTELYVRLIMEEHGIDIETKKLIEIIEPELILRRGKVVKVIYECGDEFNHRTINLYYKTEDKLISLSKDEYYIDYDFSTPGSKKVTITDKLFGQKITLDVFVKENTSVTSDETSTILESEITTENIQVPENNNTTLIIILSFSIVIITAIVIVIVVSEKKKQGA